METLYRARNWVASGPSFLLFLAAILLTLNAAPKAPKPKPHLPIKVTLAAPPAEQPQPPQPQPMPQLAPLEPVNPDITLPAMPKLTQRPTPRFTPTPASQAAPAAEPTPAPAASAPAQAVAAAPAPSRPSSTSADDAYAARVKAYLESFKHYPTSKEARLQRPRGTVEVWIVIDRNGGMKEAGVETSSGSLILDGAALQLVRGGSYPAFPPESFNGEATHRFTVQLNYSMSS